MVDEARMRSQGPPVILFCHFPNYPPVSFFKFSKCLVNGKLEHKMLMEWRVILETTFCLEVERRFSEP